MANSKGINVQERLTKAFPELPVDALMKEHNSKEKWEAVCREVDQFVEQNATPQQAQRKS